MIRNPSGASFVIGLPQSDVSTLFSLFTKIRRLAVACTFRRSVNCPTRRDVRPSVRPDLRSSDDGAPQALIAHAIHPPAHASTLHPGSACRVHASARACNCLSRNAYSMSPRPCMQRQQLAPDRLHAHVLHSGRHQWRGPTCLSAAFPGAPACCRISSRCARRTPLCSISCRPVCPKQAGHYRWSSLPRIFLCASPARTATHLPGPPGPCCPHCCCRCASSPAPLSRPPACQAAAPAPARSRQRCQ